MNRLIFTFLLLFIFSFQIGLSQDNSTCMDCHNDPELTMDKKGKTISLGVKKFVLSKSVHGKLKCVDCHQGFNPDDIPHKENITPVNCTSCHRDFAKKHNFHPQMVLSNGMGGSADVNCKGCHGDHNVTSSKDPSSKTLLILLNFVENAINNKKMTTCYLNIIFNMKFKTSMFQVVSIVILTKSQKEQN